METELIITNSNTKFNNNYIHAIFSHMQIKHLEGTPGIFKYVCVLSGWIAWPCMGRRIRGRQDRWTHGWRRSHDLNMETETPSWMEDRSVLIGETDPSPEPPCLDFEHYDGKHFPERRQAIFFLEIDHVHHVLQLLRCHLSSEYYL